jgi:hypothetical protein
MSTSTSCVRQPEIESHHRVQLVHGSDANRKRRAGAHEATASGMATMCAIQSTFETRRPYPQHRHLYSYKTIDGRPQFHHVFNQTVSVLRDDCEVLPPFDQR